MDTTDGEAASEVSKVFFNSLEQAEEMNKVKIFTGDNAEWVERQVNEWLADNPWLDDQCESAITVKSLFQTESFADGEWNLTITIYYVDRREND